MTLTVVSLDPDASVNVRCFAERRVRRGLARFAHRIEWAELRLSDVTGRRGPTTKCVELEVSCRGKAPMRFEIRDESYGRGLARLVRTAKSALGRARWLPSWRNDQVAATVYWGAG